MLTGGLIIHLELVKNTGLTGDDYVSTVQDNSEIKDVGTGRSESEADAMCAGSRLHHNALPTGLKMRVRGEDHPEIAPSPFTLRDPASSEIVPPPFPMPSLASRAGPVSTYLYIQCMPHGRVGRSWQP